MMKDKEISTEHLARMIQKGFLGTATKDQILNLEKWSKKRFDGIDRELKEVRKQLTGIVYKYEFEKLEERVKDLENLLAVNTAK